MTSLFETLGAGYFLRALCEAVLVGGLAGVVGVHVLLRRLPFFVVAMSHATFPGVVLASIAGVSLFVGGWAFGLVVVLAVLMLGTLRALDDNSVIGVVLAGAFAVGVLLQSARAGGSKELAAFLVGSILTVTWGDLVATLGVAVVVSVVLAALHKELVLAAFDADGAAGLGYRVRVLDGAVLVVITVVLVAAVPAVGTLLAVALLTVPALTARQWTDRVGPAMALAGGIGAASAVAGLLVSVVWRVAAGGAIALVATAGFLLTAAIQRYVLPRRADPRRTSAAIGAATDEVDAVID